MSRSLNRVQLIGNLGADPEMRATQDGKAIANLNIATSESWNDLQGQRQEKTDWHRVVVFGKMAEIVQQYLRKGSKIFIEGRLQTRKWTDAQGADRYTTEVVCGNFGSQMIMLDGRPQGREPFQAGGPPPFNPNAPYTAPAAAPRPTPQGNVQPSQENFGPIQDFDDDIPF